MDDEDEFEESDIENLAARPLSRLDLVVFGLTAFARLAEVAAEIANRAGIYVAMHEVYVRERQQLAQDAALEIETMTQGGAE